MDPAVITKRRYAIVGLQNLTLVGKYFKVSPAFFIYAYMWNRVGRTCLHSQNRRSRRAHQPDPQSSSRRSGKGSGHMLHDTRGTRRVSVHVLARGPHFDVSVKAAIFFRVLSTTASTRPLPVTLRSFKNGVEQKMKSNLEELPFLA